MSASEYIEELRKELTIYAHTYAYTYCKEGEKELVKTARYAIEQFYAQYGPNNGEPLFYKRTRNLRKSVVPYFKDNGNRCYGGVKLTDEKMGIYQEGTEWAAEPFHVLEFTVHGWHGHPIRDIWTSPTILEIVKNRRNNKDLQKELAQKARKAAKSQPYKYLDKWLKKL